MGGRYKPYAEYKDSGQIGLDEIPVQWQLLRVKFLFEIGRGRVISQEELVDDGLYPVYSSQTVNDGCLGYISSYDFDCDQITWTTDGANAGTVFLRSGKHNCTNVCGTLQPKNENANLKFYLYCLEYVTQFHKRPDTNGAKIMNGEMAEIFVTYPGLIEKEKIANFLDHETAKIDTLIEKQQQLIQLLKEKRQAVISHAVTKGLNSSAKMKDSGVEWLGEVPEGWIVKRLKDVLVAPVKNGLFKKKDEFGTGSLLVNVGDLYVDDYFINIDNLDSVITSDEERRQYKVEYGDIFFVRSSLKLDGIGRSACFLKSVDDVVFECHIVNARPNRQSISSKYLVRYLNSLSVSREFVSRSKTTTMTTIDQGNLTSINVLVPPFGDQLKIDEYLDEKLEKFSIAEKYANDSIQLLQERRTALISAAVTGKIDVRDWQSPETTN